MHRGIVFTAVVLGLCALAGCNSHPQAPTPIEEPPPATSGPAPQPSPTPPPGGVFPTPPVPPADSGLPLTGAYRLTLSLGAGCPIPDAERTRSYTASIASSPTRPGMYVVTLGDAMFLHGPICTFGPDGAGCHQFFASEDIGTTMFFLENHNDDAHGGHIVERLGSGGWVEIIGTASGVSGTSSLDASGTANVWYCSTDAAYPFPCFTATSCQTDLRLTFTPR